MPRGAIALALLLLLLLLTTTTVTQTKQTKLGRQSCFANTSTLTSDDICDDPIGFLGHVMT